MPTPEQIQQAIRNITDQRSFINVLLRETLNWPINLDFESIEDITYEWTDDELNTVGLTRDVLSGPVLQMQSLEQDNEQPWGIFILEFANITPLVTGRGLTGPLRKVLRGLVRKRSNLPTWDRENLLFICTHQYQYFRFAYFKAAKEKGHAEPLTTFGWELGVPPRTVCEFNLDHLCWPVDPSDLDKWVTEWSKAFDIETVTKRFYDDYEQVFNNLQNHIDLTDEENRKMFAQTLMNRLMFLRFVERKGWLKFGNNRQCPQNYLQRLFEAGSVGDSSWYNSRLKVLFFEGMAIPNHQRDEIIGQVPYLNGGLFEKTALDEQVTDILFEAFEQILGEDGLFYRYNFTVEESTPLDIDVAVDPEMLGKVFEKLINTRRKSGSYYTPRTVVQFMCRETLKGYLGSEWSALIDEYKNDNISVPQARELLTELSKLKVVDPACGSGAYLLGMLQELYTITELLDSRAEQETPHDAYQRKLQIIQNNIYGVDIDKFAVNIARLRLWLSLAVDFEGDEPDPLPNLDFKIETGDSLTAPDPSGGIEPGLHRELMKRYVTLRQQYLNPPPDTDKNQLLRIINELKKDIIGWLHASGPVDGFDWQVEFLEVFIDGGFDIVIANPPYGIKVDNSVRNQYFNQRSENERGQSKDSYAIFMARGLQLLKPNGIMSYIISDTWRTIKSHKPLRKRILDNTTVFHVIDLPLWIFEAFVYTSIIIFQKRQAPEDHKLIAGDLRGIEQGDWKTLSDNLIAVSGHGPDIQTINCARYTYLQSIISTYGNLSFFIGLPKLYSLMSNPNFQKLSDVADVKVGLQTGDNEYYIRKRENARGSYEILNEIELLRDNEISKLSNDEKQSGGNPDDYEGRHFVPYDKGGVSDTEEGWLPNYYVPTEYFIDWSRDAVNRLRTATIANVKRRKGQDDRIRPSDEETIAAVFRNPQYYFRSGITFSDTGIYSPTFRCSADSVFDQKGSVIIPSEGVSRDYLLGLLCSLWARHVYKVFVNHTVSSHVDSIKLLPCPSGVNDLPGISSLVSDILSKQQEDLNYHYYEQEQKSLDTLIYELYGLNEEDIREVELWYCRRYPRLAEAQGVLAEVKEKHADHLARCQRILEKPPSYWRSNPILQLIAQGESHTLEFKETLQHNIHTGQIDNDVFHSSLKTIAAFMNVDGGTLLIGVSDAGAIKGIERDIRSLAKNANNDRFELKIRNCISGQNSRFNPAAIGNVNISFEELQEGTICRVDVQPLANSAVLHFDNEVYLRDGNHTIKLEGRALTDWIQQKTQSGRL